MIGGYDIVVDPEVIPPEFLVEVAREQWPSLTTDGGNDYCLIYKNAAMQQLWDEHGACSGNVGTMLHLLWTDEGCTIVVDEVGDAAYWIAHSAIHRFLDDKYSGEGKKHYPDPFNPGLEVPTSRLLADQGYCCGKECLHCPW